MYGIVGPVLCRTGAGARGQCGEDVTPVYSMLHLAQAVLENL